MKTFGARGASLIYSIVWHFFLCISMANSRWNTHNSMVKMSVQKIAQRQLSTFVLTTTLRNKKELGSSSKVTQFSDKWQFYYRFTVSSNL
jgi:hypothetical protein